MFSFLSKIFPDKTIARASKMVLVINSIESELEKLSNEELLGESNKLREKSEKEGMVSDSDLPKAFALVREAAKRTLNQRHYDVQLIGGIVMHEGKIAEMLTGEGKTLAATAPAYFNSLSGKSVHVITVNDYLARRDTVWMGQIYNILGLRVVCLVHDGAYLYDPSFESEKSDKTRDRFGNFKVEMDYLRPIDRKKAYEADIIYGTNHEFGFDYLRDNLSLDLESRVQRKEHYFVIIDEVDSVLIDEARTPLIIAAPDTQSSENYKIFARLVKSLNPGDDYEIDEKLKSVSISEEGINKVERMTNIDNIYSPDNSRLVHFLNESLKAKELFKKDKDYVVRDGEIIIIDQFTGRMLHGRRFSGGLHQAIEAKEGVVVKQENRTYAQITIQNYFRMYEKISGMTGTAQTSAEEFHKVYNLDVVSIPPNKPMIRKDQSDVIYKTKKAKYQAVIDEIKKRNEAGQPILIGTTSISNNEEISSWLSSEGIRHEVLNAKNHEREGEIIAQAGKPGSITVATNMAGRGVDIILGGNPPSPENMEKIRKIGGLHIIGTERHEARRIDNQLRGRAGRQGDPGSSQFFLSLEDDLLRIFGGDRVGNLMGSFKIPEDMPIESNFVSKIVNQAQQKVEGMNFDMRKHLLDFDDVLNKQRTAIYKKRDKILEAGEGNKILEVIKENISGLIGKMKKRIQEMEEGDFDKEMRDRLKKAIEELEGKSKKLPNSTEPERSDIIAKNLVRIIDTLWIDHLEGLESLRESVRLRAYAQQEPIVEYRREARNLFEDLTGGFEELAVRTTFQILEIDLEKIKENQKRAETKTKQKPVILDNKGKKLGRNDPCHCGSGKKYKKCHGK